MISKEVYLVLAVMALFFGIGWIAYAAVQPQQVFCASGPSGTCLNQTAEAFYLVGGVAVFSAIVFYILFVTESEHQSHLDTTLKQPST
jgi:hypothetical protein